MTSRLPAQPHVLQKVKKKPDRKDQVKIEKKKKRKKSKYLKKKKKINILKNKNRVMETLDLK